MLASTQYGARPRTRPRASGDRLSLAVAEAWRTASEPSRTRKWLRDLPFAVPEIPTLETLFRSPALRHGLAGMADGIHSGLAAHMSASSVSADQAIHGVEVPDLDLHVLPYVTMVAVGFREGRLAINGHASWGTAALNTSVAATSVAGAGLVGSAIGHALLPGLGGLLGGAIGGLFGGRVGRWFANRKVRAAAGKYRQSKAHWEQRLRDDRVESEAALTGFAQEQQQSYLQVVPSPSALHWTLLACRWATWWLLSAALLPLCILRPGRALRAAIASLVEAGNERVAGHVGEERARLLGEYAIHNGLLKREIDAAMNRRASLFSQMFETLNACCTELDNALRERGKTGRPQA